MLARDLSLRGTSPLTQRKGTCIETAVEKFCLLCSSGNHRPADSLGYITFCGFDLRSRRYPLQKQPNESAFIRTHRGTTRDGRSAFRCSHDGLSLATKPARLGRSHRGYSGLFSSGYLARRFLV